MAKAQNPNEENSYLYGAARLNLDEKLRQAVESGALIVRNESGLGRHEFPYGDALNRAVIMTQDLRPFLEEYGIELRLIAEGNGPTYWTITNAATAIAEQLGWHQGARGTLQDQMLEAANRRELTVRDPHTNLPVHGGKVREYNELVMPVDVNRWIEKQGAEYRWEAGTGTTRESWWASTVESDARQASPEYQAKLARAHELHAELTTWKAMKHQDDPDKYERIEKRKAEITTELAAIDLDFANTTNEHLPVESHPVPEWIVKARALADTIALRKWRGGQQKITARDICGPVSVELAKGEAGNPQKYHGTQGPRAANAVRNSALIGWKFQHPSGINGINGTE